METNTEETRRSENESPKATRTRYVRATFLGIIALVALVVLPGTVAILGARHAIEDQLAKPESPAPAPAQYVPNSFSTLAKRVTPAVVNISTTQLRKNTGAEAGTDTPFPPGSPFGQFFQHFFGNGWPPQGGAPHAEKIVSLGSGFIVDPSGYIVTNNHVTEHAQDITVILQDGKRYKAKLIGDDPKTDLALIKIDAGKPLPAVQWGDSGAVKVGDWVLAVGNPFGLGGTVTAGIVSARGRDIGSGPFDDYLQIDAPINHGNSGGPTFDLSGKVIGINTAIYSPNGGSVGIGFAIPASLAKDVVDQIKAHGSVERGWLGVEIQPVTPKIAEGLGLASTSGALVSRVVPGGPAAKAGLKTGDVITSFNGKPVTEMRRLPWMVADTAPDKSVPITVSRNGKSVKLTVTIGKYKQSQVASNGAPSATVQPGSVNIGRLGLAVAPLSDKMRRQLGVAESDAGVVVTRVTQDGPAAQQGIAPLDVILQVGQEKVRTPGDLADHVKTAEADNRHAVLLLVERGDTQRFVALELAVA